MAAPNGVCADCLTNVMREQKAGHDGGHVATGYSLAAAEPVRKPHERIDLHVRLDDMERGMAIGIVEDLLRYARRGDNYAGHGPGYAGAYAHGHADYRRNDPTVDVDTEKQISNLRRANEILKNNEKLATQQWDFWFGIARAAATVLCLPEDGKGEELVPAIRSLIARARQMAAQTERMEALLGEAKQFIATATEHDNECFITSEIGCVCGMHAMIGRIDDVLPET